MGLLLNSLIGKKKSLTGGSKEQNLHVNRRLKCPSSILKQSLSLACFVLHINIFHNEEKLVSLLLFQSLQGFLLQQDRFLKCLKPSNKALWIFIYQHNERVTFRGKKQNTLEERTYISEKRSLRMTPCTKKKKKKRIHITKKRKLRISYRE